QRFPSEATRRTIRAALRSGGPPWALGRSMTMNVPAAKGAELIKPMPRVETSRTRAGAGINSNRAIGRNVTLRLQANRTVPRRSTSSDLVSRPGRAMGRVLRRQSQIATLNHLWSCGLRRRFLHDVLTHLAPPGRSSVGHGACAVKIFPLLIGLAQAFAPWGNGRGGAVPSDAWLQARGAAANRRS